MFRVPGLQIVTANVFSNSQENSEEKSNSSESSFEDIFTKITKRRKIRRLKENKSNQLTENLKKKNYNLPDQEINQVVEASDEEQLLETSFKYISTQTPKRRKIKTPKVKLIHFSSGSNDENSQVDISNNKSAQENEDLEHLNIKKHSISASPGSNLDASLVDPLSVSKDNTLNSPGNPKNSSIDCKQNEASNNENESLASQKHLNQTQNIEMSETSANNNMEMLGSPIFTGVTKRKKMSPKIKKLNFNVENNEKSPQNKTYNVNEENGSLGSQKYLNQTQNSKMSETSANEMGSPIFTGITKLKQLSPKIKKINHEKSPQNKTYNVKETIENFGSQKHINQTQNIEMSETSANENMEIMSSPTFNRITKRKKMSPKIKKLNFNLENNEKSPQNKTFNVNESIESPGNKKLLNQTQNIETSETSANENMEIMATPTFKRFTKQKKITPKIKKLNFDVENNKESPPNETGNLNEENESLGSPKHLNQTQSSKISVTSANEILGSPNFTEVTKRKKLSPKTNKLNFNEKNNKESPQNETGNLNEENGSLGSQKHLNQTQNFEMSETSANENMEIMGSPTFNRITKRKKLSPKIKKLNLNLENNKESPQSETDNFNEENESLGSPKHLNQTQSSKMSVTSANEILGSPNFTEVTKRKKLSPKTNKLNFNEKNNKESPQNEPDNLNEGNENLGSQKHLNQTQNIEMTETSANENMEMLGSPVFTQVTKRKQLSPKRKKLNFNVEKNKESPQSETDNLNEENESLGGQKHLNQTQNFEMSETSANENMEIMGSPTFNRITKQKKFSPKIKKLNLNLENNKESPQSETYNLNEENESLGSQTLNIEISKATVETRLFNKGDEGVISQEHVNEIITVPNGKEYFKSDSSLHSSCSGIFTQKEKTIDFSREENKHKDIKKLRNSPRLKKPSQYTDNSESTDEEKNSIAEIFEESPSEYEPDNECSSDGYSPSKTAKKKVKIKKKSNSVMHQSAQSNSEEKTTSSPRNLGKKARLKIKKLNSSLTEQTGEKLDTTLLTYDNFGTGQATSSPTLEEKDSKKVQKSSVTKLMKKIVNKNEDLSSTWNSTLQADDCFEERQQQIQPRQNKKQVIGMRSLMKMADTDIDLFIDEFIEEWLSHSQLTAKLPIEVKKELYNFLKMDSTLLNKLKNLDIKVDWELPRLHQIGDGFSSKRYTKLDTETEVLNGVFSEEENNKIMSNWKKFCKIYGFDKHDFRPFVGSFHPALSPLNQTQMKNFVAFLAQGLNLRNLYSVYYRFTTITKYYKRGRFSKTEDDILLYCKKNVPSKFVCSLCSVLLHRHRSVLNKRLKKLLERNVPESLDISQNEENENVDWEKIGFEIFQTPQVTTENRNIIDHNVIRQVASKTNTSVIKVAKAFHLKIQPTWNCSKIIYKDYFRIRLIKKILKYKYKEWGKIDWNKLNKKMYNLGPVFLYSEFRKTVEEHVPAYLHPRLKLCLDKLESKLPELEEMATEDRCLKMINFDTQEQEVNIEDE